MKNMLCLYESTHKFAINIVIKLVYIFLNPSMISYHNVKYYFSILLVSDLYACCIRKLLE